MIWRIAKKEFIDMQRDGRFRWSAGILLALLAVSAIVGWQNYVSRAQARGAAENAQREQWLEKNLINSHVAAHAGTTVFRPHMPLSVIDSGLDAHLGTSVYLEPHRRNLFQHSPAEMYVAIAVLGELTAAFVLQLLVPLLIILSTFSTFAGERERGTLRQILSLGVRPFDLALGKVIGTAAPLILVLTLAALIGVVGFSLSHDLTILSSGWWRMAFMFLAYLAYFAVFLCLGLFVSASSSSSQKAFVVLLGFWFLTCLLMPRLAITASQYFYPLPTAEEFIAELERAAGDGSNFIEHRAQIEKRLLAEYQVGKAVDLPVSTWGVTLYEREKTSTDLYNRQFDRLFEQYERQDDLYQKVSLLAPPMAIQKLSMGLAASDTSHFRNFAEAAEAYRYELVQTMNQIAIESRLYNASLSAPTDRAAFPDGERESYEQVPPFKYSPPDYVWAIKQTSISAVSLLVWLLLTLTVLPRVLRKMEVE